mmetsp:Transcript_13951/g.23051  ORF Transcript_13951/g.23051 Transcript_13951/m.23051 type:complete len:815 (+) Transcript_13951:91-2535(+)
MHALARSTCFLLLLICAFSCFGARSPASKDLYKILGVDRSASTKEIQTAFRKLAMKWHPDKNPNNPDAQAKFVLINEAYETLSDPGKRKLFDEYGTANEKEVAMQQQHRAHAHYQQHHMYAKEGQTFDDILQYHLRRERSWGYQPPSAGSWSKATPIHSQSTTLNSDAWYALVAKSKARWIIQFYANWSDSCRKAAEQWDKAVWQFEAMGIHAGRIDVDRNHDLMADLFDELSRSRLRLPFIVAVVGGRMVAEHRTQGDLSHRQLIDWAIERLVPPSQLPVLTSVRAYNRFIKPSSSSSPQKAVILSRDATPPLYVRGLAQQHTPDIELRWAVVASDKDWAGVIDVSVLPALVMVPSSDGSPVPLGTSSGSAKIARNKLEMALVRHRLLSLPSLDRRMLNILTGDGNYDLLAVALPSANARLLESFRRFAMTDSMWRANDCPETKIAFVRLDCTRHGLLCSEVEKEAGAGVSAMLINPRSGRYAIVVDPPVRPVLIDWLVNNICRFRDQSEWFKLPEPLSSYISDPDVPRSIPPRYRKSWLSSALGALGSLLYVALSNPQALLLLIVFLVPLLRAIPDILSSFANSAASSPSQAPEGQQQQQSPPQPQPQAQQQQSSSTRPSSTGSRPNAPHTNTNGHHRRTPDPSTTVPSQRTMSSPIPAAAAAPAPAPATGFKLPYLQSDTYLQFIIGSEVPYCVMCVGEGKAFTLKTTATLSDMRERYMHDDKFGFLLVDLGRYSEWLRPVVGADCVVEMGQAFLSFVVLRTLKKRYTVERFATCDEVWSGGTGLLDEVLKGLPVERWRTIESDFPDRLRS